MKVVCNPVGVVSLTVLLFFLLIAVMDSSRVNHYQSLPNGTPSENADVLSLLDIALSPLRTRVEKTYSMPFAHTAYAKEMTVNELGETLWSYPRLTYAGAHLTDPAVEKGRDIGLTALKGVGLGVTVWLVLLLFLSFMSKAAPIQSPGSKSSLLTLLCIFILIGIGVTLGPYYHILGTDKVGEDVLYQAIKSIRTGIVIGALTTIVMLPLAIMLGLMAGFFRGWVDDVIQYLYTTLSSIPGVLLIAAAILMA